MYVRELCNLLGSAARFWPKAAGGEGELRGRAGTSQITELQSAVTTPGGAEYGSGEA